MKLEKYEDKSKKKRKAILISLGVIILISVSLLLYKTFASFTESAEFPIMNGKVDYFGNSDIYFVFYQGDKELDEMPQKDNGDNLVFDYGECDNRAYVEWDNEEWAPLVKNLSKNKTKCSLYFKKSFEKELVKCAQSGTNVAKCIKNNAYLDTINLKADDTNEVNIRYVGSSPNNYIDIGDRDGEGNPILWRIIGTMNNITSLDDGEKQESLVKIIRAESIGDYSWDTSSGGINGGYGVNEWNEADLMKLLNPQEVYSGTPTIGGSLYWNRGSGNCYSDGFGTNIDCEFTSSGLSEEAKKRIAKVRWNTGTFATNNSNDWTARATYKAERGSHNGKEQCESNGEVTYCNDTAPRTTTGDGYIGLIYASDYGYAVGGSVREICLEKSMNKYNSDSCNTNNWLTPNSKWAWTITPSPNSSSASDVFYVGSSGIVASGGGASRAHSVLPVAYLKSTVKIAENLHPELEYGSQENPFILTN